MLVKSTILKNWRYWVITATLIIAAGVLGGCGNQETSTAPTPPSTLTPAPPPAPPPAPAPEKKWIETKSWSGNGIKDTENFTVTEQTRVNWETTDAKGIFQIYIQDNKGTPVGVAANVQGIGKDTTYLHLTPGDYSFKINSAFTPWKITVEQQK